MIKTSQFLNITIHSVKKNELIVKLDGVIFTPNINHLVRLQKDKEFYEIYKNADWRVCDSRIIWFLSKFSIKNKIIENITGVDLFIDYCKLIKKSKINSHRLFILGGTSNVILLKALIKLKNGANNKYIVGGYSPPFGFENDIYECLKIKKMLKNSNANVLVVALGAPKQEKFIFKIKDEHPEIKTFFAIGATIDFISGDLKRAPIILNKLGLEWLFRMLHDPKRLVKRYLFDAILFFWFYFLQIIKLYKDPFKNKI
jgi:N-acetylglucosaminyldiphosphoundecaprenol N-acetyl-beta-D-mannosaminyltransferase